MCGFAGIICGEADKRLDLRQICGSMTDRLTHRGPDDAGLWMDEINRIVLGHRRLSILDLSPAGKQPMTSPTGRFIVVFNGEIYNHPELRKEIENVFRSGGNGFIGWRGYSDTETLLAGFDCWGVEQTLQRTVGMFALAVWDREHRTVTLGRDRFGEKPLYYGWNKGSFFFASELKALRAFPGFPSEINRDAAALFFRHNYIPTPYSIYSGVFKLCQGSILTLKSPALSSCPWRTDSPPINSFSADGISVRPYWSLQDVIEKGRSNQYGGTESEAVDELERLLFQAVESQQISDVPLGAFLSGGVDSSTIVALMQAGSQRPVKTYTIGFGEGEYNEAKHAKAVASYLGTDHTELYVTPEEALSVIPRLSTVYDEPFSDASQIPTLLVAELARRSVVVSLSGDGGDELFGGYNRHCLGGKIWGKINCIPYPLRLLLSRSLSLLPPAAWDTAYSALTPLLSGNRKSVQAANKIQKLVEVMAATSPDSMYRSLVSTWKSPADIVIGAKEPQTQLFSRLENRPELEHVMMYLDSVTYLPDDILVKVDRAAMAVSLETRVPFLDHRVVEFAWRLPLSLKIRDTQGKYILKQVLYRHVPQKLIDRPKQGFSVPLDSWLRGPLREWAETLLDGRRIRNQGLLNPLPIRQKWFEHQEGKKNWQDELWAALVFQSWLEVHQLDF